MVYSILIIRHKPSPGDEFIQLCEHLIDLDPVLEVPGGSQVGALVDHDPAHVRGAVLAGGAVARLGGAAAVE